MQPITESSATLAGRRIQVMVLGDVGRSPRMRYHASSLAAAGAEVDLLGYAGAPLDDVTQPGITPRLLAAREESPSHSRAERIADTARRWSADGIRLARLALSLPCPDHVLLQIPPAFPAAIAALLVCRRRGARLVLDWHNLSASQLAVQLGPEHVAVRALDRFERFLAPRADRTLCVSQAMADHLRRLGARSPAVLYDRPAAIFAPTPPARRSALLARLAGELKLPELGIETEARPVLLVSSTSWTADEDFGPLVDAVSRLSRATLPPVVVLITGRGRERSLWEARFRAVESERVRVRTLWLGGSDYAALLGSADLGLCLHRSSSALDLPMKIADMLGAGLPVCALDYGPCLREILHPESNGLLFRDGAELASLIAALFEGFPRANARLETLRAGALRSSAVRWSQSWNEVALPLFL